MNSQGPVDPRSRLPWFIAGAALIFALIILVRSEIGQKEAGTGDSADQDRRVARTIETPRERMTQPRGDSSDAARGKSDAQSAVSQAVPQSIAQATAAISPSPTVAPTPALYGMTGVIVDDRGNPVAGAAVRVTYADGSSQKTMNALSSTSGQFEVSGLKQPDIDVIVVEASGYSRSVIEKLKLPLPDKIEIALTPLSVLDLSVLQADLSGQNAKPFTGPAQFFLLQQRSAASLTSTLAIREAAMRKNEYAAVFQQQVDIKDGKLTLQEVQPGEYKAGLRAGNSYAESDAVMVDSGRKSASTITLGLKWPVTGLVIGEPEGKALGEAQLRMERDNAAAQIGKFSPASARTDNSGRFVFEGVEPGRYMLTAASAGYTTRTISPFEVPSGAPPLETSITMSRHRPAVRVSVLNGDGQPAENCRLVLLMTSPTTKSYFSQSDAAGQRTFENLAAGRYTLSATVADTRSRQKTVDFTLAEGTDHDVQLMFAKTVRVVGIARQAGKPFRGMVTFMRRGSVEIDSMVRTDEKGGYVAELEPGEYMAGTAENPNAQVALVAADAENRIDVEIK